MRVLLADDHTLIRDGLKHTLEADGRFSHFDEASSGLDVLGLLKKNRYDLMLLDISLADIDGIEVLTQMQSHQIVCPTLVVSFHAPEMYALQALRLGAKGYISKSASREEYIRAIENILNGKKYLPADFIEKLAFSDGAGASQLPHEKLSDRESQVMIFLAAGCSLGDIAKRLCLSEKTVSTYRSRILQKMGLNNNVDLAKYAIANKLIQ